MRRKLLYILMLFGLAISLTACDLINIDRLSQTEMQIKLMDSREVIRSSNIGIETALYRTSGGIFTRVATRGQGSGVVFYEDEDYYYALTNHHVVDDDGYAFATYTITTFSGNEVTATLVASMKDYDLALIRFAKNNVIIPLMDIDTRLDDPLRRGELVLAVGNPSGIGNIVTYGEYISMTRISNVAFSVIYHSALIHPGNSGGALADINGKLIGINTWGSQNKDDENFAVPLKQIHAFLDEVAIRS